MEDQTIKLRELEPLLRKTFSQSVSVKKFETESFLKPGENFGSTIFRVEAMITTDQEKEKQNLDLIAKMLPLSEERRRFFDSDLTFKKEIFLYESLMPFYKKLMGPEFNLTPEYFGGRLSLELDAGAADNDAVILMENVKPKGYYMAHKKGK